MIESIISWLDQWKWHLSIVSALMFIGGLAMLPVIAVRIPEDYFLDEFKSEQIRRHPALHILVLIVRNVAGVVLIVVGILLSLPLVPGQGLLTILVGLMIVTIPGKRMLLRRIVSIPQVFNGLNALRARYNHPPLKLPGVEDANEAEEKAADEK